MRKTIDSLQGRWPGGPWFAGPGGVFGLGPGGALGQGPWVGGGAVLGLGRLGGVGQAALGPGPWPGREFEGPFGGAVGPEDPWPESPAF